MRKSRFSDEQIIKMLKEKEAGAKLADVCLSLAKTSSTRTVSRESVARAWNATGSRFPGRIESHTAGHRLRLGVLPAYPLAASVYSDLHPLPRRSAGNAALSGLLRAQQSANGEWVSESTNRPTAIPDQCGLDGAFMGQYVLRSGVTTGVSWRSKTDRNWSNVAERLRCGKSSRCRQNPRQSCVS